MGGTRFAHLAEAVRIDRAEHDAVSARIIERLAAIGIDARVIPHLRSKVDFGDIDLLCARSQTHGGIAPDDIDALLAKDGSIAAAVGAIAHERGQIANPSLHMLVEGARGPIQVDLVSIEDHLLAFAQEHMSWGDVGTMVAVVGRQMGLKIGMTGLTMTRRHAAEVLRARVELDWAGTLEMLGFDPAVHAAGFDTRRDTFEWLAKSRYFDPRIYALERQTNYSRQRALKRPGYMEMLAWIEAEQPTRNYDWGTERGERTEEHAEAILERFPETRASLDRQVAERAARRKPAFFNGDVVGAITGVKGRELQFIVHAIVKELGMDEIRRMEAANDHAGLAKVALRHADAGVGMLGLRERRRQRWHDPNGA